MENKMLYQGQKLTVAHLPMATGTSAGRLNNTSKEPSWRLIILYFPVASLTFEASCLQYDHVKYNINILLVLVLSTSCLL